MSELDKSYLKINGSLVLSAEALVPKFESCSEFYNGRYGILVDDLRVYWKRGMGTEIAQLYELVVPGLILS